MSASIARLSSIREAKPPKVPEPIRRMLDMFGLGQPGAWIAWEIWGRGASSYVMVTDGRAHLNVSGAQRFPGRDAARHWARAYFAGLGMEGLPERRRRPSKPP